MILILSSSGDTSIDFVISWLETYNHDYKRINADEVLEGDFSFSFLNKQLCVNGEHIDLNKVQAIWYRKFGRFNRSQYYKNAKEKISDENLKQLSREFSTILNAIILIMRDNNWLTAPTRTNLNKVDILNLAKSYGFNTPKTYLISKKQHIVEVLQKDEVSSLITKSVYETFFMKRETGYYSMFTKEIETEDLTHLPDFFFPSLLQEKIPKEYEIRVFYLDGYFFSMGIFSQGRKETELDFRKFLWNQPIRKVPYKLPESIENKLDKMLMEMNLNCCSIDLIRSSEDGEYYFLEINPTGEFGMVSIPCNYDVHKRIAEKLIEMDS